MENACLEELSKSAPEKETGSKEPLDDEFSKEEDFEDAMDVKCEDASGVDFSVPADVDFKDQCEMMKNVMKNIPSGANMPKGMPQGMPENMPSGVNIPNMNIPE